MHACKSCLQFAINIKEQWVKGIRHFLSFNTPGLFHAHTENTEVITLMSQKKKTKMLSQEHLADKSFLK